MQYKDSSSQQNKPVSKLDKSKDESERHWKHSIKYFIHTVHFLTEYMLLAGSWPYKVEK
jgi:hypothetical protein